MELSSFIYHSIVYILCAIAGAWAYRFITKPLKGTHDQLDGDENIPIPSSAPSSVLSIGNVTFDHEDNGSIVCIAQLGSKYGQVIDYMVYLGFHDHSSLGFELYPLCYKTGGEIKYVHYQCREILRNKMIQAYNDHVRENKQSSISDFVIPKQKPSPTATYGEYK